MFEAEGTYEDLRLSATVLEGARAVGARFLDCTFSEGVATRPDLERTTWRGGGFEHARLIGARLAHSSWNRVELLECAVSGAEALACTWKAVTVRGGLLEVLNLRDSRLTDVVFEDCTVREVDLGGARLERVRFPGCRIERLDLTGATLHQVDLRAASLGISRGFDRLGGARVTSVQLIDLAPHLAAHLGLIVD